MLAEGEVGRGGVQGRHGIPQHEEGSRSDDPQGQVQ